jgi:hypothetical protein
MRSTAIQRLTLQIEVSSQFPMAQEQSGGNVNDNTTDESVLVVG